MVMFLLTSDKRGIMYTKNILMIITIIVFGISNVYAEEPIGYKYFKFGLSLDEIIKVSKENGDACDSGYMYDKYNKENFHACYYGGNENTGRGILLYFEDQKNAKNLFKIKAVFSPAFDRALFKKLHESLSKKYGFKSIDSQTAAKVVQSYDDGSVLLIGESSWPGVSITYEKLKKKKTDDDV
jgi:hypothetical protein